MLGCSQGAQSSEPSRHIGPTSRLHIPILMTPCCAEETLRRTMKVAAARRYSYKIPAVLPPTLTNSRDHRGSATEVEPMVCASAATKALATVEQLLHLRSVSPRREDTSWMGGAGLFPEWMVGCKVLPCNASSMLRPGSRNRAGPALHHLALRQGQGNMGAASQSHCASPAC